MDECVDEAVDYWCPMLYGANFRFFKKRWHRVIDCEGNDFRYWADAQVFVPPTWQLIQSCEAWTARRSLGVLLFGYDEIFLSELGIMSRQPRALCRAVCA